MLLLRALKTSCLLLYSIGDSEYWVVVDGIVMYPIIIDSKAVVTSYMDVRVTGQTGDPPSLLQISRYMKVPDRRHLFRWLCPYFRWDFLAVGLFVKVFSDKAEGSRVIISVSSRIGRTPTHSKMWCSVVPRCIRSLSVKTRSPDKEGTLSLLKLSDTKILCVNVLVS